LGLPLAQLLERRGLVPPDILQAAIRRAEELHEWLGQVTVDDHLLTEDELAAALAEETGLARVDLSAFSPDPAAMRCVTQDLCLRRRLLPLAVEHGALIVAVGNPLDAELCSMLGAETDRQVVMRVAPALTLQRTTVEWFREVESAREVASRQETPESLPGGTAAAATSPRDDDSIYPLSLDELLTTMAQKGASDLHLAVPSPPLIRVDGELRSVNDRGLRPRDTQELIYAILSDWQVSQFEEHRELDLGYGIPGVGRFRINVFRQRGSIAAVLRAIPHTIPTLDGLGMPPVVKQLTSLHSGLILVTGPTGSGKSTTQAAIINEINSHRRAHIITIEDPIEFLHSPKQSQINQREIGTDTDSFSIALRYVLRQDPDVILIGEMRDLDTIRAALTAAETGHLVIATLHTNSAGQTIDRIIDVFPPEQQEQVRSQLANVLEAVLTQTLLPHVDGRGRCCAQEILLATSGVRSLIREGKVYQIPSQIQVGGKQGMQTMDQALKNLVLQNKVAVHEAAARSTDPHDFERLLTIK
jgi:twitching motility protein PilT